MAKSNHLPVILFIVVVWLRGHLGIDPLKPDFKSAAENSLVHHIAQPLSENRLLLRSVYRGEIGVREKSGRNDGRRIEGYLSYTGNKRGDPWCASFVCWALAKAGVANPRSAWSPHLFPTGRLVWKRSWQKQKELPQAGDVFGIWFSEKGRIAHCGFIEVWSADHVITVEGNTNESGSREGDGVYRKRRLKRALYAVASWLGRKEEGHEI